MSFYAKAGPQEVLGSAIGEGLGQGLGQSLQIQAQRSMLQNALQKAKNISTNPNATPLDQTFALIEATAGIPGSERYLSTLLPQLLNQTRANQIFPGGNQGGQIAPTQSPQMNRGIGQGFQRTQTGQGFGQGFQQPQQQPGQPTSSSAQPEGLPQQEFPQQGGLLPRILLPNELQAEAQRRAVLSGDASSYPTWLSTVEAENQQNIAQNESLKNLAREQGISDENLPEYMKIGERFSNLNNPRDWAIATNRAYREYQNNKQQLANAFKPGFFTGLIRGNVAREKSLKSLEKPVQALIKDGFEQEVRQQLAENYLSPTEVEEVIHPLSQELESKIKNISRGNVDYEEIKEDSPQIVARQNTSLSNWLKKNIGPSDSLSVIRHKLWKDRGIHWRQYADALSQAIGEGLELQPFQRAELTEVNTQAPRDSLSDIFTDWPRTVQYIRGNK